MKTKHSRRDFLRFTTAGAFGAMMLKPELISAGMFKSPFNKNTPLGLQLYTIRDAMTADPKGSLKKVADLGYKFIELANYADGKFYGFAPAEFRKIVNDLGLEVLSSHINVESAANKTEDASKIADIEYTGNNLRFFAEIAGNTGMIIKLKLKSSVAPKVKVDGKEAAPQIKKVDGIKWLFIPVMQSGRHLLTVEF
jgi:hypothetical protein